MDASIKVFREKIENNSIVFFVVVIFLAMSFFVANFFTVRNLMNVLIQISVMGIAAIGLSTVVFGEGIDLSIGANITLSAIIGASVMVKTGNFLGGALGIPVMLIFGSLVGFLNGIMITKFRIMPILMTLTAQMLLQGFAIYYTQASTISNLPDWITVISAGKVFGIPLPIYIMAICYICTHYILKKTGFGRMLFATGESKEAARLVGIPVEKVRLVTYVFSGFCAAGSGLLLMSRLKVASPGMGEFLLLDIVSAVILGGASIFGGKGSLVGTFFGVLLIGLISNGINLLGLPYFATMIIKGAILFLAVIIESFRR